MVGGFGVRGCDGRCGERARRLYEAGKAALAERFDAERGLIRAETDLGCFT
ncbi:MAG: hypothetical protein U0232_00785 [Thermomicrobiales bacterium]